MWNTSHEIRHKTVTLDNPFHLITYEPAWFRPGGVTPHHCLVKKDHWWLLASRISSFSILSILVKLDSILQNISYKIWSLYPPKCLTSKYIGSRVVEYRWLNCHWGRSLCSNACNERILTDFVTYSTHTCTKYFYWQISIHVQQLMSDNHVNGKPDTSPHS